MPFPAYLVFIFDFCNAVTIRILLSLARKLQSGTGLFAVFVHPIY